MVGMVAAETVADCLTPLYPASISAFPPCERLATGCPKRQHPLRLPLLLLLQHRQQRRKTQT